jgi:hypothetical protein
MPEGTMIISILAGLIMGLVFARFRIRQLLLAAHHLPYRFWRSYDELYDAAESKFTYDMVGDSPQDSHADFLISYHKSQPNAKSRFKSIWDAFAWQLGRDYGLVLLASLALFWSNYLAFIGPFIAVQLGYFIYLRFRKQYRLDFFAILMIGMVLEESVTSSN